ncbi:MAG: hypothetical protein ACYDD1_22240, partial [Caulobacteraceae bacterium]
ALSASIAMTIFDESWSGKPRLIGDLERPDHRYLTHDDACYFFGEYTAGGGYGHSSTNQLILNLKKSPELKATTQWKHKIKAIEEVAGVIAANFTPGALERVTFVPIPPSKVRADPEYDDRMIAVAKAIGPQVDVREFLVANRSRQPRHSSSNSRDPDELRQILDVRLSGKRPDQIVIIDDMLTTGCSFKVCKEKIGSALPDVPVFGLFVARRAIDSSGFTW